MKINSATAKLLSVNTIFLLFMYVSWIQSWIHMAINADPTFIVVILMIGLVIGIGMSLYKGYIIDKEVLDSSNLINKSPDILKSMFGNRLEFLQLMSSSFVILGLAGTVIGFIIGLHGLSPDMLTSIDTVVVAVVNLMVGMSVAFYTTLVGCIANMVLDINISILNSEMTKLYCKLVE